MSYRIFSEIDGQQGYFGDSNAGHVHLSDILSYRCHAQLPEGNEYKLTCREQELLLI